MGQRRRIRRTSLPPHGHGDVVDDFVLVLDVENAAGAMRVVAIRVLALMLPTLVCFHNGAL